MIELKYYLLQIDNCQLCKNGVAGYVHGHLAVVVVGVARKEKQTSRAGEEHFVAIGYTLSRGRCGSEVLVFKKESAGGEQSEVFLLLVNGSIAALGGPAIEVGEGILEVANGFGSTQLAFTSNQV